MADHSHDTVGNGEAPSQGVFIGNLAAALFVFALLVAAVAIIAGASHGFQ